MGARGRKGARDPEGCAPRHVAAAWEGNCSQKINLQMGKPPCKAHMEENPGIPLAWRITGFWSGGGEENFVNCEELPGEINGSGGCAFPDPDSLLGGRVGGPLGKGALGEARKPEASSGRMC